MTKLLDDVFKRVASLPPDLQDGLARQWLAELEDESRWNEKFARTTDAIDTLAERALRDHAQGKTIAKGIDEL